MSHASSDGRTPAETPSPEELLADVAATDEAWRRVRKWAEARWGREPSVESLLFLIGIHARDGDFSARLKKEMKQDLIMEGTWEVLAGIGVYRREGDAWRRVRTLPVLSEDDQERLLKMAISRYLAQMLPDEGI